MPSFFSRFRHKKSGSSSSRLTSASTPGLINGSPPSQHRAQQADVRDPASVEQRQRHVSMPPSRNKLTSPSAPALDRRSLDDTGRNRPVHAPGIQVSPSRPAPPPPDHTIVIDSHSDPRRDTHSPPFQDEEDRPPLPTTSSNVNNPPPGGFGHDVPKSSSFRALSPLSEISASPFDIPASFMAEGRDDSRVPSPPPFPHVDSVNRDGLKEVEGRRPKPVVSESGPRHSEEGSVGGHFGHVESMLAMTRPNEQIEEEPASGRTSMEGKEPSRRSREKRRSRIKDLEANDIPARRASLKPEMTGDVATESSSGATSPEEEGHLGIWHAQQNKGEEPLRPGMAGTYTVFSRRGSIPTLNRVTEHLGSMHIGRLAPHRREDDDTRFSVDNAHLQQQRSEQVHQIMGEAAERRRRRSELSEFGQTTFEKASMGHLVGKEDTVDVQTRWMKPVIQERIIPREHIEYRTVIDREVHKHHIYPKIQPISDPNPIVLEPRHRIFSAVDNQWHEVVGDAAAIELLGEDVFYGGPKEVRESRRLALPALDGSDQTSSITANGDIMGELTKHEATSHGADLTDLGYGTGGKGRVVEREGLLGEHLGEWKDAAAGRFFGRTRDESQVGLAL